MSLSAGLRLRVWRLGMIVLLAACLAACAASPQRIEQASEILRLEQGRIDIETSAPSSELPDLDVVVTVSSNSLVATDAFPVHAISRRQWARMVLPRTGARLERSACAGRQGHAAAGVSRARSTAGRIAGKLVATVAWTTLPEAG
ncbi:MAG: hypothetical protein LAT56_01390 [Wenzhouxiangella sp.]|nr:hypothetical protein [Wenzhouxiangella sp.]